MGIFGDMDTEKIPSNPYWVEEGEYRAQVTGAEIKTNKDGDKHQLVIQFTILNEDSDFYDKRVSSYLRVYPGLTKDQYNLLPADERRAIKRDMTNVKNFLCGNPGLGRKGLGVDPDDLDSDDWNPKSLVNLEVNLAVNNAGEDNQYSNVRWANLAD